MSDFIEALLPHGYPVSTFLINCASHFLFGLLGFLAGRRQAHNAYTPKAPPEHQQGRT